MMGRGLEDASCGDSFFSWCDKERIVWLLVKEIRFSYQVDGSCALWPRTAPCRTWEKS